jgi:hypothetical protein
MGWLRELMDDAGQPSFESLARTALCHSHWPKDIQPKPRSLGTILGRLDRDLELDWLAERPVVQQVLSELLHCPLAELVGHLGARAGALGEVTDRLRLDDLRTGRSLELCSAALPPSIPTFLSVPRTWNWVVWKAPFGAGKTLVAKWLTSRGLAETVTVTQAADLLRLPPSNTPLYVDCLVPLTGEMLSILTRRRGVCVATALLDESACRITVATNANTGAGSDESTERLAQEAGSSQSAAVHTQESSPGQSVVGLAQEAGPDQSTVVCAPRWLVVEQESILEHLEQAIDWTSQLLPANSTLRPAEAGRFLRQMAVDWGVIETLADVIFLCGLIDELGSKCLIGTNKKSLVQLLLKRRLSEHLDRRDPKASGLRRMLPEILVEMAKATLTAKARSLFEPRSFEDFVQSIPSEHRHSTDLDWLRVQLSSKEVAILPRDLERAERKLPPGAHRIVTALREAEILVKVGGELHAMRPHFLVRMLDRLGREELVRSSPAEWGEALLGHCRRALLIDALTERANADPTGLVEDVLELLDEQSPALVTALESVFVVLGLGVLAGLDLPSHTAEALVEEQNALASLTPDGLPQRRIGCAPPTCPAESHGAYLLAALALEEGLPPNRDKRRKLLLSVSSPEEEARSYRALDEIARLIHETLPSRPRWLDGALSLFDRLRHQIGVVGRDGHPHPLLAVGTALDEVEHGVLVWSSIAALLREPWQLDLLPLAQARRTIKESELVGQIWEALVAEAPPEEAKALLCGSTLPFWLHAPAHPVVDWLLRPAEAPAPVPTQLLPVTVWQALAERSPQITSLSPQLLAFLPRPVVKALIASAEALSPAHQRVLWENWPEACVVRIEAMRITAPQIAVDWLLSAPPSADDTLVTAVQQYEWVRSAHPFCAGVRQWLHATVAQRTSSWRRAYQALCQFEAELRQVP